jgi:probable HAF family extracellular repeat protein
MSAVQYQRAHQRDARRSSLVVRLGMGIVVGLSVTGVATAQPTYRLVEIASGLAHDIDSTGTYVTGYAADPSGSLGRQRAFVWNGGAPVFLAAASNFSQGLGVNASGQVVGVVGGSQFSSQDWQPYRWSGGTATPLQPIFPAADLSSAAHAINAAGRAVGRSSSSPSAGSAVFWPAGSPSVTTLSREYVTAEARAINDAGDVVGSSQLYCEPYVCWRATRWSNGGETLLEPPAGFFHSFAYDLNEAGHIVGAARSRTSLSRTAVLWIGGMPTVLAPLNPSDDMIATGINASSQVVGERATSTGRRGFLWQGGVTYDLTGLLDASGAGAVIHDANAISDDGRIAAYACFYPSGDGSGNASRCVAAVLVPAPPAPPVPSYTRYLAEGATSAFFETQIALLNPGSANASATLQYLPAGGAPITQAVTVPARTRLTINPKLVPGLANAEFSTVVQTSQALIVDRTMSWDAGGYGSHSEAAVRSPATTWYLAEGATIGGFDLFYLLQNPAATPTTVQVRYLRAAGMPLVKTYTLAPNSRTNIWVNVEEFAGLGKALAAAEFSAVIESQDATPIIVERAMYRSNQGRTFNAGHESTGVTSPATSWFLAEGATGAYFDMFVLIANPTATDAQVTVRYLTVDGTTYSRSLLAPANARTGIWVDQEEFPGVAGKPLADAAVSTTVQSTNGVPVVVERAMWWPGDSSTWHEAHNSAGATVTGTRWAVAEGEVGGIRAHETYLLIANTSAFAGSATVTLMFEDGTSAVKTYPLPPSSRTNVAVGPAFGATVTGRRFGAVIESTGTTPAQILVERAMYSSGFAAGTNALATRLQ